MPRAEIDALVAQLRGLGVFGRLAYKEQLLPQGTRQGEPRAASFLFALHAAPAQPAAPLQRSSAGWASCARPPSRPPAGLHSEQLALVDMLVLAEAQAAVGHCMSSFSSFLRELRALRGAPKPSMRFVEKPQCRNATDNYGRAFAWGWVFTPP